MNKMTVALNTEQYESIITSIKTGFTYKGKAFRPNSRIATILILEANLGLRIGDIFIINIQFNN